VDSIGGAHGTFVDTTSWGVRDQVIDSLTQTYLTFDGAGDRVNIPPITFGGSCKRFFLLKQNRKSFSSLFLSFFIKTSSRRI
jgi:hypothetical protein